MDERDRIRRKKQAARRRARQRQVRRQRLMISGGGILLVLFLTIIVIAGQMNRRSIEEDNAKSAAAQAEAAAQANTAEETTSVQDAASAETVVPEEEPVTVTLSFTGDCTLGTDENFDQSTSFNSYYDSYGAEYFLQNVRPVFEADDITVVNMEGTFTYSTYRADKTYAFKASPEYVSILSSSSVEAANLANNHSHDYGDDSYADTKETLQNAGISYFGNGNLAVMDVNGVKVGLSGVYELPELTGCEDEMYSDIENLKSKGAQIIVVEFHWGIEKESVPDENQVYLAHAAIEAGADLVVGAHPHVLQGIEMYQGKPIVYSMGNFCFGGNSNPSDKDSMIYQQTFTVQGDEITESVMNIIPCSLSSHSDYNDYQPMILEGDEAQRVLTKIQDRSDAAADTYGTLAAYVTD